MRRLFLLAGLATLVFTPSAQANSFAFVSAAATDSLSLVRGTGTVRLYSTNGAIIGSVRRGRVTFVDVGGSSRITVCGRRPNANRIVTCSGRYIRFSVLLGAWRMTVTGTGIYASARVRGIMRLRGTAGTYSIDGGARRAWPRTARYFRLG